MGSFPVLLAALVLDRLIGDPDWLWRRVSHPVVGFGLAIGFAERRFNRSSDSAVARRRKGCLAIAVLLFLAGLCGLGLEIAFDHLGGVGVLCDVLAVSVLLAQKSLADHVAAVADGLSMDGLAGGRRAVSMIVGRDPETLDEAGVSRAAIESLAENFSDGIVAPALWYAVLGLPGLFAYKMLNTADSMIGHLNDRYRDFGRASAKLDDLANWPASRLSAMLIAAGAGMVGGFAAMKRAAGSALRDQGLHRSPNAGWPEAAMAGGLNLALGGPRRYRGELVMEAGLNASGRRKAGAGDIIKALAIFRRACDCLALSVLATLALLL